jgi:putative hemolysin
MISQLMSVVLHCHHCGVIAASSSQEAVDAGFAPIRVFDNRDKDKAGELETVYSLCSSCFHHMRETLVEGRDVGNIFAHH